MSLLHPANPRLVEILGPCSTDIQCTHDRVLFQQGDTPTGLYLLHSGEGTISIEPDISGQIHTAQIQPCSVIGLPAVVGGHPHRGTAVVHGGTVLSFIDRGDLMRLMKLNPELTLTVFQLVASELHLIRLALVGR